MTQKRISVFGLGYVGLVTGVCLAQNKHTVIGVDANPEKVNHINNGEPCIYEPQLAERLKESLQLQQFTATTDYHHALVNSDISFISVGTPSLRSGEVDTTVVKRVITKIADILKQHKSEHIIVMRSTVPPGTAQNTLLPILKDALGEQFGKRFHYLSNPEFLRESSAIFDFYNPPETVVGCECDTAATQLKEIYQFVDAPFIQTSNAVAECIKYVDNSWHALKVVFTNEIASICKSLGINGQEVMDIFCQDTKLNISTAYFRPGFAFGGSCLPKDLRGLLHIAEQQGLRLPILTSILKSNFYHIDRAYELVTPPGVRHIAMMGIAFKSNTDDVRESPLIRLAERLIGKGYSVAIYDKHVKQGLEKEGIRQGIAQYLGHLTDYINDDFEGTLANADVIVIGNNSDEFKQLNRLAKDEQIVVDLVNLIEDAADDNYRGIC